MKKFLALALSFALTLPLAACGGNPGNASAPPSGSSNTQDSIQISYAHMGAESSMVGAWGILFKEKVEAASDGKITVNIFSNGEMGSDVEAIESVILFRSLPCSLLPVSLLSPSWVFLICPVPSPPPLPRRSTRC